MSTITLKQLTSLGFTKFGKVKTLLELDSKCVYEINTTLEDYEFTVEYRNDGILYFCLYDLFDNDEYFVEVEDLTIIVTSFEHLKELIKPKTIKTAFDLMYLGIKHK